MKKERNYKDIADLIAHDIVKTDTDKLFIKLNNKLKPLNEVNLQEYMVKLTNDCYTRLECTKIMEMLNCVVNVPTEINPLDFTNAQISTDYDKTTMNCIRTLFGQNSIYFYNFIYQIIWGQDNFKKALVIKSPASYGKTWLLEQIGDKLFGKQFAKVDLTSPWFIGTTVNKKVVLIDEVPAKGLDDEQTMHFKHTIGAKYISANIKYGANDMFENNSKKIIAINNYFNLPPEEWDSLFERMWIVECDKSIYTEEFKDVELDINTIVSLAYLTKDMILKPTTKTIDAWKYEINSVIKWLESCVAFEAKKGTATVLDEAKKSLQYLDSSYYSYKTYCEDKYKPFGYTNFRKVLDDVVSSRLN